MRAYGYKALLIFRIYIWYFQRITSGYHDVHRAIAVTDSIRFFCGWQNVGRSDETCDKCIDRFLVELIRRSKLFQNSLSYYCYTVLHGHGLNLIMCYVDNGNVLGALDFFDLTAHFFAECSVQIGKRLI